MGLFAAGAVAVATSALAVEFNRDVRPILADHCFQCHGPDARQRQAELRLDTPDAAAADRKGGPVVVAGKPDQSELWRRIISTAADERMPPPDKGSRLSDAEIATLKQWIIEGAKFERHWSLLPVRRPPLPPVTRSESATSPIDTFVLARLEKERLAPSPPADRHTLLRRVTLALTGLPPTPAEIELFISDRAPDAYERLVDRLLASPRYGERMAIPWLEAARYADTSGYQSDGERYMWRWRDWVIEALNANMPFDQFTIEQLAGDLLPTPTLDQKIATGFNRNHRGNAEGGIIPEEYAVEYVADRVETTATVWLGLTLGCCRCHDHKYDPFTQRDFYSLFAFFNNVPEKGRAIKIGNSPPFIQAPTRLQASQLEQLISQRADANERWQDAGRRMRREVISWRAMLRSAKQDWYPSEGLQVHLPLDGDTVNRQTQFFASTIGPGQFAKGIVDRAGYFDGQTVLALDGAGDFGFFDKFTLAAWVKFDPQGGGTIVSRMTDQPQGDGYQLAIVAGKLQFNLVKRWLDDALRVETAEHLPADGWHHVAATYDGSRLAEGVKLYIDGQRAKITVLLDELNQTFATKEPLRIGGGGGQEASFRGLIDEVRVYAAALPPDEVQVLATRHTPAEIIEWEGKRTAGEWTKLERYWLEHLAPPRVRSAFNELKSIERDLAAFEEQLPTVMVMEELPTPRPAHVLLRGQYDKPGERVEPNVPAELPPLGADVPRSRLALARWLVDPANPLTSRVTVNRVWQLHFGTGIVKTSEDFGRQGEWPSHPELLDWLAAELMEVGSQESEVGSRQGSPANTPMSQSAERTALSTEYSVPGTQRPAWDMKHLVRLIVTSATFRQASAMSDLGLGIGDLDTRASAFANPKSQIPNPKFADPDNRLLSRGPRLRLSAEMVRDQALFASGLLVEQLGGPSVRPWQPPGLWSELTGGDDYQPGTGAEQYRRSLYTFWKRTIPPPTMATFDASTREACIVRQSRTNTPLQALALLNEPAFVEAARALAKRVLRECGTTEPRIQRAMLHAVGREPNQRELAILVSAFNRYRNRGAMAEVDALALICNTILNLDEAVTSQ